MPRFFTLSDAIRAQVEQLLPPANIPTGSPLAPSLSASAPLPSNSDSPVSGIQRWGFSTWGVEPFIGQEFPEDS